MSTANKIIEIKRKNNIFLQWYFLNGNLRPAVLVEMVCANKWDLVAQQMKPSKKFVLVRGSDGHTLLYDDEGKNAKVEKVENYN